MRVNAVTRSARSNPSEGLRAHAMLMKCHRARATRAIQTGLSENFSGRLSRARPNAAANPTAANDSIQAHFGEKKAS